MKQLIVAADDLGLTESINRGIAKSREDGIVTSFNIMPSGEAFENALEILEGKEIKDVGAHLSLTETKPVSDINTIPTLIAKGGSFHRTRAGFIRGLFLKKITIGDIYRELKNQLEMVRREGIVVTSLSSHEHIHMLPEILKIFIALAKEYNIPAVRCPRQDRLIRPFSADKLYRYLVLSWFNKGSAAALDKAGKVYPDSFRGFLDSGRIGEEAMIDILNSLSEGVTELVVHPGFLSPVVLERYSFHKNCEAELHALTSPRVKALIESRGIKLITYSEFLSRR